MSVMRITGLAKAAVFTVAMAFSAVPLGAVEPHEMLADPALEARAQALDEEIRCVKCRSEVIASSNASWAADARVVVREMILDGASDQEVRNFFVKTYGEYALMTPNAGGSNLILWLAGPAMLILGGGMAVIYLRRRSGAVAPDETTLSDAEAARLREIMKD